MTHVIKIGTIITYGPSSNAKTQKTGHVTDVWQRGDEILITVKINSMPIEESKSGYPENSHSTYTDIFVETPAGKN